MGKIRIPNYSLSEELINAISHGIGAALSIAGLVLLIVKSANMHNGYALAASIVYGRITSYNVCYTKLLRLFDRVQIRKRSTTWS